jgi:hypothetical protein
MRSSPEHVPRGAPTRRVALALALALVALTLITGVDAKHEPRSGFAGSEHARVSLARAVADLAVADLGDAAFTLGRIDEVQNAVRHDPEQGMSKPRGVWISVVYDAVATSPRRSKRCVAEAWETLAAETILESNVCEAVIREGSPGASFADPWEEGVVVDAGGEEVLTAAGSAALPRYGILTLAAGATEAFSCSARREEEVVEGRTYVVYRIAISASEDCADAVAAKVTQTPEDLWVVFVEEEPPKVVGWDIKGALAASCAVVWAGLWLIYDAKVKRRREEAIVRKQRKAEADAINNARTNASVLTSPALNKRL